MTPGLIIGIFITVAIAVVVAMPLRRSHLARNASASVHGGHRLENLLFEREAALLAIRDLQLDFEMGKLSESDFREMDSRYRAHAIEILKELDALGVAAPDNEPADDSLDAWIERAVAEARQGNRRIRAEGAAEA